MRLWVVYRMLDGLAWLIWRFSSPAMAQLAAFHVIDRWPSRLARIYNFGRKAHYRADYRVRALNHILCVFTQYDPNFTLHVDVENADALIAASMGARGVLICTAHLGLTLAAHRALHDLGYTPAFVIFDSPRTARWNWGHPAPLTVIDAGRPDVLVRCSRHIQRGDAIIAFVDYHTAGMAMCDGPQPLGISPNAFAWAHLNDIPILFMASRLDSGGRIVIELENSASVHRDGPATGASTARAFAEFLEQRTGWRCIIRRPKEDIGVAERLSR